MLYVFYGSDRGKVLSQSDVFMRKMFNKNSELSFEKFDADTLNVESLAALAGSQSLFGGISLVLVDGAIGADENFVKLLPAFQASIHIFVLREGDLGKLELKKIEKHAEKIEGFEKIIGKKPTFNVFAFTDALGERNRKQAWILYRQAIASGVAAEEIFWKVVWQIKTMLLAKQSGAADEAGLNPFVYRKAKGNLKQFKPGELEKMSQDLVIAYHNARRGEGEIETSVEKMLLKL